MKSRRLTETDLAKMAFQPVDVKRARIISLIRPKRILGSYEPFRATAGDAVNEQFPLLEEERDATPLDQLEAAVARACRGDADLLAMNLAVAKATHAFATAHDLTAERLSLRPITMAFGHAYNFGMPLLLRYDGAAHVAFPDLRRTTPLNPADCRFVWSMMHQRFRVNYPDYAELHLVVWRYQDNAERKIVPLVCSETDLLTYDQLAADVSESYAVLHQVMHEQEQDRRRGSGGAAGPLFGT